VPILAHLLGYALDMSNPYETARPWTPQEEKVAAVIVHVAAIFFEFFAPIIGYIFLKDKGPFVQHHAKESLNFSITVLLIGIVLAISIIGLVIIWWALPAYWIICRVIAALQTSQGKFFRYPLTIRFIK
jgi:uncharacterized Tic20 family protein